MMRPQMVRCACSICSRANRPRDGGSRLESADTVEKDDEGRQRYSDEVSPQSR